MRAVVLIAMVTAVGCGKPTITRGDAEEEVADALHRASKVASAMCGISVKYLDSCKVTVKELAKDSSGSAHVRCDDPRADLGPSGKKGVPAFCEGDVQFTVQSHRVKNRRARRTRSRLIWSVDSLKLVAVQTPGVKMTASVSDVPSEDE